LVLYDKDLIIKRRPIFMVCLVHHLKRGMLSEKESARNLWRKVEMKLYKPTFCFLYKDYFCYGWTGGWVDGRY
jgi:hypothetical protein